MSTRKHFIAAAQAVSAIPDLRKRREMAEHHAKLFAAENPRFDRGRFLSACGVDAQVMRLTS